MVNEILTVPGPRALSNEIPTASGLRLDPWSSYEEMLRRAEVRNARLRVAIDSVHRQDLLADIKWPDEHGRFPDAPLLPCAFPVVDDANALRECSGLIADGRWDRYAISTGVGCF